MEKYYLAVDIGASSGRHMLASMEDGRMKLEEIYRFPNGMDDVDGTLCWDVKRLFTEIKNGLKKCKSWARFLPLWGLTRGRWIMSCWIRRTRFWGMP